MALDKCPRCELNYILDGGSLCTVCRKEVHGGSEQDDIAELCTECGENPAVPGGELCLSCLKEMARRLSPSATEDDLVPDAALEIDSVSTMDEIVIDIDGEEIPEDAFEDEDVDVDEDDELIPDDPLDDEDISLDELADDEDDDDLRDQ
jgi:hypothetical protein